MPAIGAPAAPIAAIVRVPWVESSDPVGGAMMLWITTGGLPPIPGQVTEEVTFM